MTFNEYFDAIYCINLDRRVSKWEHLHSVFKRFGMQVKRIRAVDGVCMDSKHRFDATAQNRIALPPHLVRAPVPTRRSVACSLSHCNAILDAKRHHFQRILIFEDDIIFHRRCLELFSQIIPSIPSWNLLYLGASQYAWNHLKWINPHLYVADTTYGRFAYAINSDIFDLLVNTWVKFETTGDGYLAHQLQRQIDECYVISPNLFIADVTRSDLRPSRSQVEQAVKLHWHLSDYEGL